MDPAFKESEENINNGVREALEGQKKKKNPKMPKNSKNHTALYLTLGAAAIGVIAFFVLKNKK